MAIAIRTRIQVDFSSNRLTCFALARPAGRLYGLRTDGSIFRADLSAAVPTHAKEAQTVYCSAAACSAVSITFEAQMQNPSPPAFPERMGLEKLL
jgi:hypothetical protein